MRNEFEGFNNNADRPDFIEPEAISDFVQKERKNGEVRTDPEGIREVLEDLGFPTNEEN